MLVRERSSLLDEVADIVREACASESNRFGFGMWTHHIVQVRRYARLLAEMNGANVETVELAALLHDYAAVKDEALYAEHHIHGPIEAERILTALGYPQERIAAVQHCIATHRASVSGQKRSLEAQCLADADAMAHIDQVPSLMRMVYVERGLDIDEGTRWVRAKLQRSWNKLSAQAREMISDKYIAVLVTLSVVKPDAA
jgi:uncharacterized protein